jgi:hypothetical protein
VKSPTPGNKRETAPKVEEHRPLVSDEGFFVVEAGGGCVKLITSLVAATLAGLGVAPATAR